MPLTPPIITPTVIIPPYREIVIKPVRVRVGADVQRFDYALQLLTEASVATRVGADVAVVPPTEATVATRIGIDVVVNP